MSIRHKINPCTSTNIIISNENKIVDSDFDILNSIRRQWLQHQLICTSSFNSIFSKFKRNPQICSSVPVSQLSRAVQHARLSPSNWRGHQTRQHKQPQLKLSPGPPVQRHLRAPERPTFACKTVREVFAKFGFFDSQSPMHHVNAQPAFPLPAHKKSQPSADSVECIDLPLRRGPISSANVVEVSQLSRCLSGACAWLIASIQSGPHSRHTQKVQIKVRQCQWLIRHSHGPLLGVFPQTR